MKLVKSLGPLGHCDEKIEIGLDPRLRTSPLGMIDQGCDVDRTGTAPIGAMTGG